MTFAPPVANAYDLHRTSSRDATGRRVIVRETPAGHLSVIANNAPALALTRQDAADLARVLDTYARTGTIATERAW